MNATLLELLATSFFAIAVVHTFLSSRFQALASRYPEGSMGENTFHLLGEVEVIFGLWAAVFVLFGAVLWGHATTLEYVENLNFTEPLFVFAIMVVAATRPLIELTRTIIFWGAKVLPLPATIATYFAALVVGPLLGSFITEPAAMTVTALVLFDLFFRGKFSTRAKYITLATLLVNVSIGGVLTHFAAPPVLMVARVWEWSTPFMLTHFGWKAALAVVINSGIASVLLRKELKALILPVLKSPKLKTPTGLVLIHLLFLVGTVFYAHHPIVFIGLLLFFLGIATITREYQDQLKIREAMLVAFFLGGLVVLGGLQSWWLKPLLISLNDFSLFIGATGLTAITDNAALTYLGAQVDGLSDAAKYALVAGAVTGGGLTVIANAPNPVAFSILQDKFENDGINPLRLFIAALVPTLIAAIAFWLLP